MGFRPRYSTTDDRIQESIKQIINSGLFWVVGAAEKKNLVINKAKLLDLKSSVNLEMCENFKCEFVKVLALFRLLFDKLIIKGLKS